MDAIDIEFKRVCHDFNEQQERYEVCLKKMIKDRRATVQMYDDLQRKTDKMTRIQGLVYSFIVEIANRVNHLLTAEEIDIRLYAQDDIDRQQTVLYGINEEAGKLNVKSNSNIHVNNNCLQCSGNASFIKKAFKLACLTYQTSKVQYQNQEYSREELLFKRQLVIDTTTQLSVHSLNSAIEEEEMRVRMMLDADRRPLDLSMHMRNSYSKSPLNRAVFD